MTDASGTTTPSPTEEEINEASRQQRERDTLYFAQKDKIKEKEAEIKQLQDDLAAATSFDAEKEIKDLHLKLARKEVQATYGLSKDDVDHIPGTTPEEILKVGEYWGKKPKVTPTKDDDDGSDADTTPPPDVQATADTTPPTKTVLNVYTETPEEKREKMLKGLTGAINKEVRGK